MKQTVADFLHRTEPWDTYIILKYSDQEQHDMTNEDWNREWAGFVERSAKEINSEYGYDIPNHGYLEKWAKQGVLLLNTVLTVRAHQANSHRGIGWEEFTDAAIRALAEQREHLVFILWGSYAQKKGAFIDRNKHLVLTSAHPSPLSAYNGFFGNKHFSRANEYLVAHGKEPINW